MRPILLLLVVLPALAARSQCGPYVGHPVWPDTLGIAHVNADECGPYNSQIWDNGDVTVWVEGLNVGPHWVIVSDGGSLVDTLYFDVEQLLWDLNQDVHMMAGQVEVSMYAEVPYCGTQIANFHACPIEPDSTVVYLLQDGIAIDSLSPVFCTGTWGALGPWSFLPFGYTYQLYLQDHSACGSYAYGMPVQTWSCAGAVFDLEAIAATSGNNGSIIVQEVVLDPQSPVPPPLPLTGTFRLMAMPDYVLIDEQPGTSAIWEGLVPGTYMVVFTPDVLCDPVVQEVVIEASTAVGEGANSEAVGLVLWPVPVKDVLYWSGPSPAYAQIVDLQGRELVRARWSNHVDLSMLAPGTYMLRFPHGAVRRFVRQ